MVGEVGASTNRNPPFLCSWRSLQDFLLHITIIYVFDCCVPSVNASSLSGVCMLTAVFPELRTFPSTAQVPNTDLQKGGNAKSRVYSLLCRDGKLSTDGNFGAYQQGTS